MNNNIKRLLLLICCFLTAGLAFSAIIVQYLSTGAVNMGIRTGSVGMFRMFTNDGNIFTAIVALICGVYGIYCMVKKKRPESRMIYCLRLMAAVSEIIIFIIVVVVLMPMGMKFLLSGYSMIVLHAVVPVLTLFSFLALDSRPERAGKRIYMYGGMPVFIYGLIVLVLCIAGIWIGDMIPYPFFRVYDNPVWLTVVALSGIVAVTILLSFVLDRIKRKTGDRDTEADTQGRKREKGPEDSWINQYKGDRMQ